MKKIKEYLFNPLLICYVLLGRYGRWIPDKWYLKLQYFICMREILNLKTPKTFTEKIQWLKLQNRKEYYHKLVDKYEVKKIVSSMIGDEYIIPTLGVWKSFDEIDFSELPNKFVLKTTQGSHSSLICKDKEKFDSLKAKDLFRKWMKTSPYDFYREWVYKDIEPRILAEQYISVTDGQDLIDYKFYCFNGNPLYCQVIKDRSTKETIDFFDQKWIHQEFYGLLPKNDQSKITQSKTIIDKPINYEKMLNIAKILSKGIPFLRVDLYNLNGKIYFGEYTFYHWSGFVPFDPETWDYKLGELIHLP